MKLPSLLPITLVMFLNGCSILPHAGPSFSSIKKIERQNNEFDKVYNSVKIVNLNTSDESIKNSNTNPAKIIFETNNINLKADNIGKGDTLKISIIETPPAILFNSSSDTNAPKTGFTELPSVIVDSKGLISLPFIGEITVVNKNPIQIKKEITDKLSGIANRPQVIVTVVEKKSSNVIIIGDQFSGKMPLTAKQEQLLDAVTMLGSNMYDIKDTLIQITRNNKVNKIPLSLVLSNPKFNIKLQNNDVITLINKPSSFISMGATGATKEVRFEANGINLSQALARIGGLRDNQSDARGVFVFRHKDDNEEKSFPTVYQIDLTNPNSFFIMKNFQIQNDDIVYVASAPIIELQKFLYAIFTPSVGVVNQVNQVSD